MAHLKDIAITKGKIYQGGCHSRRGRFCLTAQQTLGWYDGSAWAKRGFCQNCGTSLFYRLNGICRTSVAIGMLDDANDLVIAGQIFADSHPHWDRLRLYDLPHLDSQLQGKKS